MFEGNADKMQHPEQIKAVSRILNEYHFAGSGIYHPCSVVADSLEAATELWKKQRKPLKEEEEKVEETKTETTE